MRHPGHRRALQVRVMTAFNSRASLTVNTFGRRTTQTQIKTNMPAAPSSGGARVRSGAPAGDDPARRASAGGSPWSSSRSSYDVTTETVRRDLSVLEDRNLRPPRARRRRARRRADADRGRPRRTATSPASSRSSGSPPPRSTCCPAPTPPCILDAGSTTVRLAGCCPRDLRMTVVTHAVPIAAQLAGCPADRAAPAAGPGPPPHPRGRRCRRPSRRWTGSAPTSPSSAPTA